MHTNTYENEQRQVLINEIGIMRKHYNTLRALHSTAHRAGRRKRSYNSLSFYRCDVYNSFYVHFLLSARSIRNSGRQ